jgi:membrane protease YdiL (CAAX protease family)
MAGGAGGVATAACVGLVLGWVRLFSGRNLWAGIVIRGLIDSAAMTVIFIFGYGPA